MTRVAHGTMPNRNPWHMVVKTREEGCNEPPYGVLWSREKGCQNKQGAGSRVEKSLGSREHRK